MTLASPSMPASWVPGARCCHRSTKRMKSWAVAGSTRPRRRLREYACMRARRRRDTHSTSVAPRVYEPCIAKPSCSSAASAIATWLGVSAAAPASASTVVTPTSSRRPRIIVIVATSSPPASKRPASSCQLGRAPERPAVPSERAGPALRDQSCGERGPVGPRRHEHERAQEVVEVVARLRLRRDLGVNRCDRVGIELPDRGDVDREPATDLHRVRAAVLKLLVVEERVRPRGEDLVREHRWFGRVDGVHAHRSALDPFEQDAQAIHVECLVQGVVDGLAHDHVVGDLDRPDAVVLACGGLREHRRHQVVGFHALQRRRVSAPAAEAQHEQRPVEVPAPP